MAKMSIFATEWIKKLNRDCMNKSKYQDAWDVAGSQFQIDKYFWNFILLAMPARRMQPEFTKIDQIRRQKVLFQDFKVEKSSFPGKL